ncbi:amidohydrolase [Achromobacter insolitus]|uniref:amidohydrolase n=1 Tax=Achromobacter insolitus TaxID=217204 RepID=UPI0027DF1FB5|nr:amidohydrolase [Achromobacter insolitus]MDQ6216343.1 amidohydrolase [Achromobacter insolitus]
MNKAYQGVVPGLLESFDEMKRIRHDIHRHPELGYQEQRTSGIVADFLGRWGYQVRRGVGGTGVVGTLRAGDGKRSIGLRADLDALPIREAGEHAHASVNQGVMHACGHDGHTVMLLAAARELAATRNFSGTLNVIFQPAEEGGAGALAMVEDGLFDQAPCDAVYALHNYPTPTLKFGQMAIGAGPIMASVDSLIVTVHGKGGHAASPHFTHDPIVVSAAIIQALQTIVSRNISPYDCAVVSVTSIHADGAFNVIPGQVEMKLSVRAYDEAQRSLIMARIQDIVQSQASCFGTTAQVQAASARYPVLVNAEAPVQNAREVAQRYFGADSVVDHPPIMAADDFAFMAQRVPACYINIGAGEGAPLHNAHYDFNDDLILVGGSFWVHLAQTLLR